MVVVSALARAIDPMRCMGSWHVQLAVPTALDRDAHNGVEKYTWDAEHSRCQVEYTFNKGAFDGKSKTLYQRCWFNSKTGTTWAVSPYLGFFYLPVKVPYLIADLDEGYTRMLASSPATTGMGAWCYFMTREAVADEATLEWGRAAAAAAGWDASQLTRHPQRPRGSTT